MKLPEITLQGKSSTMNKNIQESCLSTGEHLTSYKKDMKYKKHLQNNIPNRQIKIRSSLPFLRFLSHCFY